MKKSKEEAPKPEAPKTEVRDKRDAVRDKARGKRAALRCAATAASCLMMAALLGCATATPASKAQTSKACGNTITVNLNLWPGTNALACAACPGGVTITLSDLIGTQVQSADAGGNESVNQTAIPTNTSGVTGDKPIETIGEVGKTALTSGASRSSSKPPPPQVSPAQRPTSKRRPTLPPAPRAWMGPVYRLSKVSKKRIGGQSPVVGSPPFFTLNGP